MNTDAKLDQLSRQAISVSDLNNYIKKMFAQDYLLKKVCVKGEVSNLKYHSSGHIYFSLKDDNGVLSCIMFAGSRKGLTFKMEEGHQVIVCGTVDTYEAMGKYQLYAREIYQDGLGLLYERFNALKERLNEMGMFAPEYKKEIPPFCRKIGIVTSPTGAAIRDIESVARSRNPYVELILYPALVQGEGAAASIVKGIETLNRIKPDVIIIGRGGGSIEDLWAFNEEIVAQAIFASEVPIISAVGHETDFTISDFVADLRVPTPTAAAARAVPDIRSFFDDLNNKKDRMTFSMTQRISADREKMQITLRRLYLQRPEGLIRNKREELIYTEDRLKRLIEDMISTNRLHLNNIGYELKGFYNALFENKKSSVRLMITRLKGASPLLKLEQGFSYTCNTLGHAVTSLDKVSIGEGINIHVSDGVIEGIVKDKKKGSFYE